jgi:predicted transcriptional regulator
MSHPAVPSTGNCEPALRWASSASVGDSNRPRLSPLYTALYMAATRTQIYLTPEQRKRLDEMARGQQRSLAALVREAVDAYLEQSAPDAEAALAATFGRLPELEVPSRDEWDRG